jgi:hypothetical protein
VRPSPRPAASATVAASPAPTRAPTKKSPSTLRHQLGIAERELAEAIAGRDQVQTQLSAVGVDHETLVRLSADLVTAQARVDGSEERWLTLADQAESLGMEI